MGLVGVSLAGAEETSPNRLGGKFGVFGNIGYSSYAMGDVNSGIDGDKAYIQTLNGLPGFSGSEPTNIYGGLTYGGGVQYGINDHLAIGLEAGALSASPEKYSYTYDVQTVVYTGDPFNPISTVTETESFSYETDYSAMEVGPVVRGYLPIGERLLLNGSLGLDYVALNGTAKYTNNGQETDTTFSGSTLGVKVTVGGEVFLSNMISLGLDLGYRLANITNVKDKDGNEFKKADGSSASVDYSGLILQGGIRLYF
jgi:hypothetical protein